MTTLTKSRRKATPSAAILVLSLLYFMLPLWWLLVSATKSNGSLFNSNGFWFDSPQLWTNLQRTFTASDGLFTRWMGNSLFYASTAAVVGTMLAAAAGYVIGKFEFRGKGFVFGIILAGVLVPSALLTIPLYFVASWAGLTNTVWAVIIPACVSPFGVYLARVYAEASVPNEILEAARMDGAGELRIFFTIVLRILSPALVTIVLFIFVATWTNFMLPLVMFNDSELYPVTLGLYSWQSYKGASNYDIVLTGALISIIPLMIAFFSLQRFWRSGLTVGGVKG